MVTVYLKQDQRRRHRSHQRQHHWSVCVQRAPHTRSRWLLQGKATRDGHRRRRYKRPQIRLYSSVSLSYTAYSHVVLVCAASPRQMARLRTHTHTRRSLLTADPPQMSYSAE
ncbi:hypothetical protein FKM82_014029 [Ascaphus truei]